MNEMIQAANAGQTWALVRPDEGGPTIMHMQDAVSSSHVWSDASECRDLHHVRKH